MRLPAALGLGVAVVVVSGFAMPVAHADVVAAADPTPSHHRVVLIAMPASVLSATTAALGPWSIEVQTDDQLPASNAAAAAIARAHGATAVAWLDRGELVIYDDLRGVSMRHAAPPATDDVNAAAIALSIKTSLRSPSPVVALVEITPAPPPAVITVAAPERHLAAHVVAGVGAGFPLAAPAPVMMRFTGQVSLEIPRLGKLGPLAGIEAGPSASVDDDTMTGSYRDVSIAAGAEWRQEVAPRIWLVPAIAGTLHLTHLEGTLLGATNGNKDVAESANPAGVELSVGIETGRRMRGGATLYGSFLAGTDRYRVRGQDVLVIPAATVGVALRMSFQ